MTSCGNNNRNFRLSSSRSLNKRCSAERERWILAEGLTRSNGSYSIHDECLADVVEAALSIVSAPPSRDEQSSKIVEHTLAELVDKVGGKPLVQRLLTKRR